jgi:pimeloyl-ACP methyl ester carboxylesterase
MAQLGEPCLLVGHSMGGMAISAGANQAPERVAGMIYLTALVPLEGDTALSLGVGDHESLIMEALEPLPDGRMNVRDDAIKPVFYHDCSDADVAFAKAHLTPQQSTLFDQPFRIANKTAYGAIPKAYIFCNHDYAVGPIHQHDLAARAGIEHTASLDTSHSPFFSAPRETAAAIDGLMRAML